MKNKVLRIILCIIETLCIICIPIVIGLSIYFGWNKLRESLIYQLDINEQNKTKIEMYLQDSLERENLEGANRIQYYAKLHHTEYTVYYDDGFEDSFINDDIGELRKYIIEKGTSLEDKYKILLSGSNILCILIIISKVVIGATINKIDKLEKI